MGIALLARFIVDFIQRIVFTHRHPNIITPVCVLKHAKDLAGMFVPMCAHLTNANTHTARSAA